MILLLTAAASQSLQGRGPQSVAAAMQACWRTPQPLPDLHTEPRTLVRCSALMNAAADLRASALLALTKLMAIEPRFCDANLRLLFTLLHNRRARRLRPAWLTV